MNDGSIRFIFMLDAYSLNNFESMEKRHKIQRIYFAQDVHHI